MGIMFTVLPSAAYKKDEKQFYISNCTDITEFVEKKTTTRTTKKIYRFE
jgi:hypothetical protein